jgi:hypothetical protein
MIWWINKNEFHASIFIIMAGYNKCNTWVVLGVPTNESGSEFEKNPKTQTCGIGVYQTEPPNPFIPSNGFPHHIIHMWELNSAKKIMISTVIHGLLSSGVVLNEIYNPPINPNNRNFVNLPFEHFQLIAKIIRAKISGVAAFDVFGNPVFNEIKLSANNATAKFQIPSCVILSTNDTVLHVFDTATVSDLL